MRGDRELTGSEPFLSAAMTQRSVVSGDLCYIPAGQTLSGSVLVVVDRSNTRRRSMAFVTEATEAIASIFLRLSGNTWYVEELKSDTETDPLTGVPNRRALEDRLDREISRSRTTGRAFAVAMIDIDHFKRYNDTYGHQTGDDLLEAVASTMTGLVRESDLVARFGGEEFCVVMPETDLRQGLERMEVLRQGAAGPGDLPHVTLSVGVATWDRSEGIEDLLQRADQALYDAKEGGRNQVVAAQA
jgi:diguanylate cyclase (GGDEF)-like protein